MILGHFDGREQAQCQEPGGGGRDQEVDVQTPDAGDEQGNVEAQEDLRDLRDAVEPPDEACSDGLQNEVAAYRHRSQGAVRCYAERHGAKGRPQRQHHATQDAGVDQETGDFAPLDALALRHDDGQTAQDQDGDGTGGDLSPMDAEGWARRGARHTNWVGKWCRRAGARGRGIRTGLGNGAAVNAPGQSRPARFRAR